MMKIVQINAGRTRVFSVERDGKKYTATVWTEESGERFSDWEVVESDTGDMASDEVSDAVVGEIDKNWENLP